MGLLDAYKIKKSLAVLLAAQDPTSPQTAQALSRLKAMCLDPAKRFQSMDDLRRSIIALPTQEVC